MLHTHDWFTNHIDSQQDTLVADGDWLKKLYGAEYATGAQFSLRCMSLLEQGYHQPIQIVRHDNLHILDELNLHDQMHDLRSSVLVSISSHILTIVVPATECTLEEARFGIYCGHHGTIIKDAAGLARALSHFHPGLLEDAGAVKPICHDIRDAFQLFTRAYLSRKLVIQDFDILRKEAGQWQAIETKRHKCSVDAWLPYTNDSRNFRALTAASEFFQMAPPLCVGYCVTDFDKDDDARVSVSLIQRATYEAIFGQRCVVSVDEIWDAKPDTEFCSRNRAGEWRKAA